MGSAGIFNSSSPIRFYFCQLIYFVFNTVVSKSTNSAQTETDVPMKEVKQCANASVYANIQLPKQTTETSDASVLTNKIATSSVAVHTS